MYLTAGIVHVHSLRDCMSVACVRAHNPCANMEQFKETPVYTIFSPRFICVVSLGGWKRDQSGSLSGQLTYNGRKGVEGVINTG
jgi:hypothetical protein